MRRYAKDSRPASVHTIMHVLYDPDKLLLSVYSILLGMILSTSTVLYCPLHPIQYEEYFQPCNQRWCCAFARTRTFPKLRMEAYNTMDIAFFINCLSWCVGTVRLPKVLYQRDMLLKRIALARSYLLYSALPRTREVCLTETCQYNNICCYYFILPTLLTGTVIYFYTSWL